MNRLVVPFVVAIRTISMLLIPVMLAAAGANGSIGFRNVFIIFSVLSLIAAICAVGVKDKCIGKI